VLPLLVKSHWIFILFPAKLFRIAEDDAAADILNVTCLYNNYTKTSNWRRIIKGESDFIRPIFFVKTDSYPSNFIDAIL
jgi:hypothetical protein